MKKIILLTLYAVALITSTIALPFPTMAAATTSFPQLCMPVEHINYVITQKDNQLWAEIDGQYSIYTDDWRGDLPMVYPMPPNSTNIHIYLNSQELPYENYTKTIPEAVHETAVGDWWMIQTTLRNISDFFLLEIHYEHPIQKVNGSSSLFLYDLNIIDYLSKQTPNSTAHFNLRFESPVQTVQVYTAPVDAAASQWQPKEFTDTFDGAVRVVSVEMSSFFGEALPGDLAVVFSSQNPEGEVFFWVVLVGVGLVLVAVVFYLKRGDVAGWFFSKRKAK